MANWEAILNSAKESTRPAYEQVVAELESGYNKQAESLVSTKKQQAETAQKNYDTQVEVLTQNKDQQAQKLDKTKTNTLKANYATYMKNKKSLPYLLAAQGIRGGLAETTLSRMMLQKENNAISARNAYTEAFQSLMNGFNQNQSGLGMALNTQMSNIETDYANRQGSLLSEFNANKANQMNAWNSNASNLATVIYQAMVQKEIADRQAEIAAQSTGSVSSEAPTTPNPKYPKATKAKPVPITSTGWYSPYSYNYLESGGAQW